MTDINTEKLDECWDEMRKYLRDGMISGDIWDSETGFSLSANGMTPDVSALFNRLTTELKDTLDGAGFPGLRQHFLMKLKDQKMFVVINHGRGVLQGLLLNPQRVNMGLLFTVAIPKSIAKVAQA